MWVVTRPTTVPRFYIEEVVFFCHIYFLRIRVQNHIFEALIFLYTSVHSLFSGNESTADLAPTNRNYNEFLSVCINPLWAAIQKKFRTNNPH